MSHKTKRQQQVSKILRKKGRFISKSQAETEIEAIENEVIIEGEEGKESEEDENINYWTEEDLNEFEKVGKRLITEVLQWHENAAKGIRAAYNGTSRTTTWRKKRKKEELEYDAKGMRTLDTLFRSTETSTSKSLPESMQSLQPRSPSPSSFQNPSLVTEEIKRNLQKRLEEINQQCSITKSAKTNNNVYTYDYLRCLSIQRYIQLLLDGQGKMDASNQIAQTIWNKGDYIARCIWKWGNHFIKTGELLIYHQGKHTKLKSLLNDEDFKEECQAWL